METWQGLKELQARHENLVLSVHTVKPLDESLLEETFREIPVVAVVEELRAERALKVRTPDGRPEARNRRVEMVFR